MGARADTLSSKPKSYGRVVGVRGQMSKHRDFPHRQALGGDERGQREKGHLAVH